MIKDANGKNVFKIKMRGKSFALNLLEKEQAAVSQENNVTALWHKRLGHFHHNGVFYMKKNQLAIGLPNLNYVPQVKRDKLDKKAKAGIFEGYNNQSKTYRVYMPHADKVIVSIDVKFMEDHKWSWDAKKNQNFEFLDENIDDIPAGCQRLCSNVGVDFSETFTPIARLDTIRMLLALTAQKGWKIYQLDVKSTFLIGYLEEEIFVEQPEGLAVKGKEDTVYQLKKALYGLKQAPRAWYNRINTHLLGSNQCLMDKFKAEMEKVFEMTNLGDMYYFLGMEVHQNQHEIFICQQKYAKEILKKFKM
ncbi:Retrovirus-related Pol polyprotein from transposon TNT 1-94 [Vitis vinifera]|uniref:Retrovirus-related Pol polyprotein from transposon TNT 1-94 n=1 Tax=Vitis vinifera TaxID=29760 RepID=A0A438CPM8_VITVI|nr:Retrovirus-related Pol polyprotein from transposon TNT 1-94 [Vitis vinifera]